MSGKYSEGDDVIRLLGFLIGSAASLGVILLVLGVPDINLSQPSIEAETTESTVQIVEELAAEPMVIVAELIDETAIEITDEIALENTKEISEEVIDELASELPAEKDLKWHAFWNPFRSRIAAEGFVGQLEKVTGIDYRVIKIDIGVYEVAFTYEDDVELRDKMSLIASATGLDLPQS